jgi:hypothetical protein
MGFVSVHRSLTAWALVISTVLLAVGGASASEPFSGRLEQSDPTLLNSNKYFDTHTFQAGAGDRIAVDMRSDAFDTYLIVESPSGQTWENDDWQGDTSWSHLDIIGDAAGQWTIYATSFSPSSTGAYTGSVDVVSIGGNDDGGEGDPFSGRLDRDDETRPGTGEFYDERTFEVEAGQQIMVDMHSSDFDTYVIIESPSGERWSNDDWQGDMTWSHLEVVADVSGQWRLVTTSFQPGEYGDYTGQLAIAAGRTGGGTYPFAGELDASDPTLEGSGEYFEVHTFRAQAGQEIIVDMQSDEFDTYLILESPSGQTWSNDDYGTTRRSYIRTVADQSGNWRVIATSYSRGSTGSYTGYVQVVDRGDITAMTGALENTDGTLPARRGAYFDEFTFRADAGDSLVIEMSSSTFDTYLIVESPSGQSWSNDDYGSTRLSHLEIIADQSGTWRVIATSFSPNTTGEYRIEITGAD